MIVIQVLTRVPSAVKKYECSDHIQRLAKHKDRPDGPFRDPQWIISKG